MKSGPLREYFGGGPIGNSISSHGLFPSAPTVHIEILLSGSSLRIESQFSSTDSSFIYLKRFWKAFKRKLKEKFMISILEM